MRTFLFVTLMALSLTVYCQSFTNYCLPIETARLLIEDAVKKRVLDTLVNTQAQKIELLTQQNFKTYNDFQGLLSIERAKFKEQKAISADFQKHSQSFADQLTYYEKINRKQKRQNLGLKILLGVAGGLIIYQAAR